MRTPTAVLRLVSTHYEVLAADLVPWALRAWNRWHSDAYFMAYGRVAVPEALRVTLHQVCTF